MRHTLDAMVPQGRLLPGDQMSDEPDAGTWRRDQRWKRSCHQASGMPPISHAGDDRQWAEARTIARIDTEIFVSANAQRKIVLAWGRHPKFDRRRIPWQKGDRGRS